MVRVDGNSRRQVRASQGQGQGRRTQGWASHSYKAQTTAFSPITLQQNPESQAAGALGANRPEPSLEQVLKERDEAIAK